MTDAVRQLVLAFIQGQASADDVLAAVKLRPTERQPTLSTEQTLRATSLGDTPAPVWDETWADVRRMWGMLTPDEQAQLTSARRRAGK